MIFSAHAPTAVASLASHRTLHLNRDVVAVLADKHTGWCVLPTDQYGRLKAYLDGGRSLRSMDAGSTSTVERLWHQGLIDFDGKRNPATIRRPEPTPSSLLLKLTGACNFVCEYCYDFDSKRFRARLGIEQIRRAIDYLLGRRNDLSIAFHGGEPLLRFDVIRTVVAYVNERHPDAEVSFSIQTNAALLSHETVSFFQEHSFSVGVSLDGFTEEANALRSTGGKKAALAFVLDLIDTYGEFVRANCGFLAVVSRRSVAQVPKYALELQARGIQSLSLTYLDLTGRGINLDEEKLSPQEVGELYLRLLEMICDGEIRDLALRTLLSYMDNLFSFTPRDLCHKGPCGAADEFLVLDAEGQFRTCDCVYNAFFEMGENVEQTDGHAARKRVSDRHAALNSPSNNASDCANCALYGLCGGTCVAKAIASSGQPATVDPVECHVSRTLYPELLREFGRTTGDSPIVSYYHRHRSTAREQVNDP